ncbi:hypothetical protein TW95_gp1125 [Pandoravirus inopinatum]|uniref:Uncharacterized protein n=1 Tax=Pandoravirus inopinatum TaxID=1605721 RepID=A0A0B5J2R4_9VIRU|nr:hypothetical protein TW95_gp1125 [Pandoravirus inopinatum]AJF97859.1 hypothetical protein [Pandoravirus inopinatum]
MASAPSATGVLRPRDVDHSETSFWSHNEEKGIKNVRPAKRNKKKEHPLLQRKSKCAFLVCLFFPIACRQDGWRLDRAQGGKRATMGCQEKKMKKNEENEERERRSPYEAGDLVQ